MIEFLFYPVLAAVLCSVNCALLGSYLVLRRMSLLGDAISHAVLPGLVAGWMISQSRDVLPMLAGALVAGVLTALLAEFLRRVGKVTEDAALGTVFTILFALGVLMVNQYGKSVDLDPGCVLYGSIESVKHNRLVIGGEDLGVRAIWVLGSTLAVSVIFIGLFYKELLICSFDQQLAATLGFRPALMHYLLMVIVALATVAAFESVGSILVVAMLIVPAAAAHLLTDRLWLMQLVSVGLAILTAIGGTWAAVQWNTSMAGMMAVTAGVLLVLAALFSPWHGIVARHLRRLKLRMRIYQEDVLGILYRLEEQHKSELATPVRVRAWAGGGWGQLAALRILRRNGWIAQDQNRLTLTDAGRRNAKGLVRSHRLWEALMVKELGYPATAVHAESDEVEHFLSPAMEQELNAIVQSAQDPHGKKIPEREQ